MPCLPTTPFGFLTTDHSFHGVDPITDPDIQRDVILYDIRVVSEGAAAA